jgi:3-isopropylmalate/(R)-2-methylmalate dehydratase small subunit
MTPFTTLTGTAVPFMRDNIDTDVIIRIERLTTLTKHQLGLYALEALRLRPDGTEDPRCILNQPPFRGAPILLAGANFGCGSSREAAVWALMGMGVRCVVAPSFGDIFFANCFQNGLLPIRLHASTLDEVAAACADGQPLAIDLQECTLTTSTGTATKFGLDATRREGLLLGLDDIGVTLKDEALISTWQRKDRKTRAWAWPAPQPTSKTA